MNLQICQHIKPGGTRCGSPALRGLNFCFYHSNMRESMPLTTMFMEEKPNVKPGEMPVVVFDMPFLEDAASIQIAFMQLIHGVAHHRLDPRRAQIILSALHGVASNLRALNASLPKCVKEIGEKAA
jgi:hypothetical protein